MASAVSHPVFARTFPAMSRALEAGEIAEHRKDLLGEQAAAMHSGHLNGRLVAKAARLTRAGPLIVGWRGRAGRYALPDHDRRSIASPAGRQD